MLSRQPTTGDVDEDSLAVPPSITASAISEFWLTALNHVGLSELVTDQNAGAPKYLIDLRGRRLRRGRLVEKN